MIEYSKLRLSRELSNLEMMVADAICSLWELWYLTGGNFARRVTPEELYDNIYHGVNQPSKEDAIAEIESAVKRLSMLDIRYDATEDLRIYGVLGAHETAFIHGEFLNVTPVRVVDGDSGDSSIGYWIIDRCPLCLGGMVHTMVMGRNMSVEERNKCRQSIAVGWS